jgi:hypothetical protein
MDSGQLEDFKDEAKAKSASFLFLPGHIEASQQ